LNNKQFALRRYFAGSEKVSIYDFSNECTLDPVGDASLNPAE
jgi:hypothetical protein